MVEAFCLLTLLALCSCQNRKQEGDGPPKPKWEEAKKLDYPGLPNLHKISDDLYRGAQPKEGGFAELKKLGVKTVVNLRSFHSDHDETRDANLDYVNIYMKAWHPEDKEMAEFLRIISDKNKTPVFVHCQHGADRTGLLCALYRVAVQGWSKEDAIKEMKEGDFGHHDIWVNLTSYFRKLDIDDIRKQAGLTK